MNSPNRLLTTLHRCLIVLSLLTASAFAQDAKPVMEKALSFEAAGITGAKVRFPDDYKGKIVMLDFWAMWCGPCLGEIPNLAKVFADLNPKGFEVLSISLDSDDKKLPEFTKGKAMTWAHVLDGRGGPLAKLYEVKSIPTCYLVDGTTGKVLATSSGLRGAALRPTVEKALGLPPSNTPPVAAPQVPGKAAAPPDPLLEIATKEVKSGLFLDHDQTAAQVKAPKPGAIALVQETTQPRSSREIAKLARAAHLRAGWFFRCTKCEKWHLNLAGAYAIAPDVVATANHVIAKPDTLKEGWLIVADEQNKLYPTKAVLGADATADTALLRVSGAGLKPLPISSDVELGAHAYCFSDPLRRRGYFSDGIVNRFYSDDPKRSLTSERLNVSTDWAQGSSGSAILDESGNVIGHVARIQTFNSIKDPKTGAQSPGTTLVLHEAIPAKVILHLVKLANEAAAK